MSLWTVAATGLLVRRTFLCAMVLSAMFLCSHRVEAQEVAATTLPVKYERNNDCLECHSRLSRTHDFVQTDTGPVWESQDKHARAFAELQRNESLVTRILGFPMSEVLVDGRVSQREEDRERVTALRACLSCHATWPVNESEPPVELSSGVSCQACHGPGLAWSRPHRESWWRLCTPEAKGRLGFADVRDPLARTQLCVSCHVGDHGQGRFVTHAMYAAGHPPLPGFEYTAFRAQMPAHWRSLHDKGPFAARETLPPGFDQGRGFRENFGITAADLRSSYREANYPGWDHEPWRDLPHAKDAAVASLATIRGYARLMRDVVDASATNGTPADFALFDCAACHHELGPSLLTTRSARAGARPGRPSLVDWPIAVAQAALDATQDDSQTVVPASKHLLDRWASLQAAATRRPFGDHAEWMAAAEELECWANDQASRLASSSFERTTAMRFAQSLATSSEPLLADYPSARQVAWALREIARDLRWEPVQRENLFRRATGEDPLIMELPSGQNRRVVDHLPASLDAAAAYEPEWMRSELQRFREELNRTPNP